MATEPDHLHGLLTFLDPLLGDPSLVAEAYYRATRQAQIGHDEAHVREQLPGVMLHLRYHPSGRLPIRRLIEIALVPDHRLVPRRATGVMRLNQAHLLSRSLS